MTFLTSTNHFYLILNVKLQFFIDKSCLNFNGASCLDGNDPQTTVRYLRTKWKGETQRKILFTHL